MKKIIGRYKIKVKSETEPDSPRNWDNLGTMVCFHKRYDLGDKHNYSFNDYSGWDEMEKAIIKRENVGVILPLYLLDHSGITISTTDFNDRWDSGRIGFIFISKDKMLKEYGGKICTKQLKERVKEYLVSEVKTYDQYLRGEVYGFQIFDKYNNEIDSCWGFYDKNECMKAAEECVPEQVLPEQV
jgi:hypothetical protein